MWDGVSPCLENCCRRGRFPRRNRRSGARSSRRGLLGPWGAGRAWEPRQSCPPAARCPTPALLVDPALGQARSAACEPGFLLTGPRRERSPHHTASPGFPEITPCHPLRAAAKSGSQPVTGVCDVRLRRDEGEGGSRQGRRPRQARGSVRAQEAGSVIVAPPVTPSDPHAGRRGVGNKRHLPAASVLVLLARPFPRVSQRRPVVTATGRRVLREHVRFPGNWTAAWLVVGMCTRVVTASPQTAKGVVWLVTCHYLGRRAGTRNAMGL